MIPAMRYAVLGAGAVGTLIGAALRRNGHDVVLLMRPETLAGYTGRVTVESVVLGDFEVELPASAGLDRNVDYLLAGGLNAENIGEALSLTNPPGVDISSGVESAPGVKNVALIEGFFDAVRSARARSAA